MIGPPLGGALFGLLQPLPFIGDAISYAVSVVSLLLIRTRFQGERTVTRRRLHREIGEGLVWLWRQPLIRFIAFLTGSSNLLTAGLVLIVIELGKRLQATDFAIGLIFSIGGVGGILGAIVAPALQKRLRFAVVIIGSALLWAVLWPLLIYAPNIWWLGVLLAASFVLSPIYNVTQMSYRLALIPDSLQGRVNSVFRLLAFGGQPIGFALTGFLLDRIGVADTIWVIFGGFMVMFLATVANRHVRHARPVGKVT